MPVLHTLRNLSRKFQTCTSPTGFPTIFSSITLLLKLSCLNVVQLAGLFIFSTALGSFCLVQFCETALHSSVFLSILTYALFNNLVPLELKVSSFLFKETSMIVHDSLSYSTTLLAEVCKRLCLIFKMIFF